MMPEENILKYIGKYETGYPEKLRIYDRMPSGLYYIGASMPDNTKKSVAIVGARNCSSYGKIQARNFASALAARGVQIISGMAYGVDSCAHQGALDVGGITYAILGCGADVCYPKENFQLYKDIQRKGAVISEYEPGTPPLAMHFPIRNRIISALADIVLVIEARHKSGSLITADYALEQGKSVYALPGRLDDVTSSGCNELITQGAALACSPEQILFELGISEKESRIRDGQIDAIEGSFKQEGNRPRLQPLANALEKIEPIEITGLSEDEVRVLSCVGNREKSLDQILMEAGMSASAGTGLLMQLTMKGLIREMPGGFAACGQ